jgi:hypothetical protein
MLERTVIVSFCSLGNAFTYFTLNSPGRKRRRRKNTLLEGTSRDWKYHLYGDQVAVEGEGSLCEEGLVIRLESAREDSNVAVEEEGDL